MKSKLYKIAVLSLLAALSGVLAFFAWPQYLHHAEDASIQSVARRARKISAVEVLRLSDAGESGPEGSYVVQYDHSKRGIAARYTLTGAQASELVRLWGEVRFVGNSYMAACHDPGFVLRFTSGQRSIFEAAVCFHCENVSWQSTPFTTSLRQMAPTAFDKKSSTTALEAFLMPLQ